MQYVSRRAMLVCALVLGAAVGVGHAEEAVGCADYISSQIEDVPMTGILLGEEERTVSYAIGTKVEPGGIGGSLSGSYTITWTVGYYWMSDGSIKRVDCRFYRLV